MEICHGVKKAGLLSARRASLWLLSVLFLLATTAAVKAGDYTYTTNADNTLTITHGYLRPGYTGPGGDVTIPSEIDGRTVTILGFYAFGIDLFNLNRRGETSVIIPDSVKSVDWRAFYVCSYLTNVVIGKGVTNIGSSAFYVCIRLTSIVVNVENSLYSSLDEVLFNKNQTTLIQYPQGRFESYVIPASVSNIGSEAFAHSFSLTGVKIPDGVTSIGKGAFNSCTNLTEVMIPNSVTNIGSAAFADCENLVSVTISTNVSIVEDRVFEGCKNLTSVTIPDGVTSIGESAFAGCTSLTSVAIPDSVTNIGDEAFSGCSSLPSVTIPDSVTSIGNLAFGWCYSLTSVMISDSVTSIGNGVFYFCYSLTSITVDQGNSGYSSVDGILFNKIQTELIQYPARKAGRSYTIPDSVTCIGDAAFYYSLGLNAIVISDSVTNIGDEAFQYCDRLIGVYFAGNAPSIGLNVFKYYNNYATVYYLPGTTGWGWTFGGRPAMPWWDGPQISANGTREDVSVNRGESVSVTVATAANSIADAPLDWWIIVWATDKLFYLNNSKQWSQFDGNFSNCRPVYQGGMFDLPPTEVLNTRDLQPGSYTFWFAVDYPMDGILNLGGYILIDSVNVMVN